MPQHDVERKSELEVSESVMGKGKRLRNRSKAQDFYGRARELLTANFQKQIRNSELWPQMVAEFGEEKAEALLKQCKGELRSGLRPDESGKSPTDIL